jgi:hypothetical protein
VISPDRDRLEKIRARLERAKRSGIWTSTELLKVVEQDVPFLLRLVEMRDEEGQMRLI